jgi:hypothetical protein
MYSCYTIVICALTILRRQIMVHFFTRITLFIAALLLTACTNPRLANDLALCKKGCQHQLNSCSLVCRNNCLQCGKAANCSAARHYNKYKQEQIIQGRVIARELNSYRDPLQCRKVTCNCLADYNVCTQSCEGVLHKRLQPVPACC